MKAQREGGHGPTHGGDPTSAQIADDDAAPSDTIQLSDESDRTLVVKMVQHLGAQNEVDAAIGNGKRECVATDRPVHTVARR